MDYFIIIGAFIAFIVFLGMHVIVLRRISDRSVIPVFWMTYAVSGVATYVLLGSLAMSGIAIDPSFFTIAVSWTLYTLLVGNYFMGIFGLMESSIRMRVLGEVVRAGAKGMSRRALLNEYNHTKIVNRRLARFIDSGDIECTQRGYVSRKPFTFFLLPAMALHAFWRLYGRTNIVYNK